MKQDVHITLPAWLIRAVEASPPLPALDDRMRLVIDLAERNIDDGGGPFAAAVFEIGSGRIVAAGVNRVMACNCAIAHAEMIALGLAQQQLGSFDLAAAGLPAHELVTSAEPCTMCQGAVLWSGVRRLVYGATDADVRGVGFDEGPKAAEWRRALEERGIEIIPEVLRDEAAAVLQAYATGGGRIYNSDRAPRA